MLMSATLQRWNSNRATQLSLPRVALVQRQEKACKDHTVSPPLKKPRELVRPQQTTSLVLLITTNDSGQSDRVRVLVHAGMTEQVQKSN